jgi:hypothetical protein
MGRLIRHGKSCVTFPVCPLPVPMIESAFGTPLVPAVGISALQASRQQTASRAAIALPAITVRTNPEHRLASLVANSPPENHFWINRHPPTPADFDIGNGSCQGRTSLEWWPSHEGCQVRTPLLPTAGSSPAFHATIQFFAEMFWRGRLTEDCACGADDVAGPSTPAIDSKTYVF